MKKLTSVMLVLVLFISIVFANGSNEVSVSAKAAGKRPKFLTVGTAGTGGAYYPIGITMADIATNTLGIQTTAQVTGGAVENNKLVQDGTIDIAITQSSMGYAAVNGVTPYAEKLPKVKAMFTGLSQGIFHVVTLKKTGITSMADLKGKVVVMGPAGGGAINMAKDIWKEYGFGVEDVKATYISYSDGISALKDGKCDAVVVQSAAPASAIQELAATDKNNFLLISVDDEHAEKITSASPYYSILKIAPAVYGTEKEVQVIYLSNMIVCSADLDEGLVYDLTKVFMENIDKIKASNPAAKALTKEGAVKGLPIELHPGALRYFKEVGLIK